MTDRPILFSSAMVRAILREIEAPGTGKTMTRRVHEPHPKMKLHATPNVREARFVVGDRLYVRETWGINSGPGVLCTEDARPNVALPSGGWSPVVFRATTEGWAWGMYGPPKWRPAIHMPRTASRLTLTVTGVKVERLQDISRADVIAEGMTERDGDPIAGCVAGWHEPFAALWDSLNGKREGAAWADNPFVVAVSFRPELRNIDAAPAERATAEVQHA